MNKLTRGRVWSEVLMLAIKTLTLPLVPVLMNMKPIQIVQVGVVEDHYASLPGKKAKIKHLLHTFGTTMVYK
jgi:hypothetical protein